jgi:hypothetical protein
MHATEHGIGFGGGQVSPPGFSHLLRAGTVNEMCLSCHQGGDGKADTPPDIMGPATYESSTLKRAAGSFQAAVGVTTPNGHALGLRNEQAPGGTWASGAEGMTCLTCHAPHGNSNYRNLVLRPGNATSDCVVTDVTEDVVTPTAKHYSVTNLHYTGQGLGGWCQGCHTKYHGQPGDPNLGGGIGGDTPGSSSYWFRHPTEGVTMAQGVTNLHLDPAYWFTGAQSRVPVVSPSKVVPGTAATSDNQPFCGTCHKAHGSPHRAASIWDDPSSPALEEGTDPTQTCQACHYK